jgi:heptosyltransferase-2
VPNPALRPNPHRILIRGVNWLGDAIMTTPALSRLRERFPRAQIILLTPEKLADLWQRSPSLDSVLTFSAGEGPWAIGRRLRQTRAELGLVLPNSPRSALELRLAGIPERIGYSQPWRDWWLTRALPRRPGRVLTRKRSVREIKNLLQPGAQNLRQPHSTDQHQLHEYLQLVAALGADPNPVAPCIHVAEEEMILTARKFGLPAPDLACPFVGLNPGAEYGPAKRWPTDRFIAVANRVQTATPCRWLLFGGRGDLNLADEIARAVAPSKLINLAGKTSLRELCALLKLCRLLLTNDTGPMHLAAAVGTPVVALFGSTSPELTGPGLPADPRHQSLRSNAACSPCFRRECPIDFRCMTGISPEIVAEAVLRAMRR